MTDFTITEEFPKNEIEFDQRFSNPTSCYDYLFKQKWPNGFICNKCAHTKYWLSSRNLYICTQCEHQHSLTAGTIMDSSKKPITYWFKAMWWFTTRKSGINAVNLKELLEERPCTTTHKIKKELSICQSSLCLDLVSFPVLSQIKENYKVDSFQ